MLRNRNHFDMMVDHIVTEEGLNPRNVTLTVSAWSSSVSRPKYSGHNQLIATDKLTEGQRKREQ